jgi:hypothetical protein
MRNFAMIRTLNASFALVAFAKANDEGTEEKVIDKAVYLTADKTLEGVVAYVGNAADATLRLIGAMTTHLIVRAYHPVIKERATLKDTQAEIMATIKDHAAMKRGYDFNRAWTYRLLSASVRMARSLVTDYDKKGVQDGSPLQAVLRSKTVDKAVETVMGFITDKTKGATSFASLERALNPVTAPKTGGSQRGQGKGGKGAAGKRAGGNSAKPETIAAVLAGDKGAAVFNAVEAKSPVARAMKLADKMVSATIDHFTMAKRFIAMIDDPEKLLKLADLATEHAKAIHAKASKAKDKGEGGTPEKAVAAQG